MKLWTRRDGLLLYHGEKECDYDQQILVSP